MLSQLRKHWTLLVLGLVLLVAGFMRLYDVNFDQNTHQHPDERFITQVALDRVRLVPGAPLSQYLDPARSPLNPRINGQDFHYGALILYLGKGVASLGAAVFHQPFWVTYDGLPLVGRTLAGIFDLLTVLLIFLIARRLYGKIAGLLAAIFSAFAVIQIQIAHFWIAEPFLVTFLTASLYFSVVLMQSRRWWAAALAGLMLGFALACKVSVVAVAVLIIAAVLLRVAYRAHTRLLGPPRDLDDPTGLVPATRAEREEPAGQALWRAFPLLLLAGLMTLVGFTLGDPYGVLDSGLVVRLSSALPTDGTAFFQLGPLQMVAITGKYLAQLGNEAAIQKGTADVPYTIQFVGTTPVLYNVQQIVQWGMGPASGIIAMAGLLMAFWLAVRRRAAAEILLLSGMIPYFLTIVTLESKWPRYILPIVPYLCILAGAFLARGLQWSAAVAPRLQAWRARGRGVPLGLAVRRWVFPGVAGIAVLGSLLWAVAFMNIYTHDHSRVIASRWMLQNIPAGATIGHETWDDALPLSVPGLPNPGYQGADMGLYDFHPSPEEFTYIANLLQQSDYIIPASNRLYGSIPHEPWRYPVQMRYYQLLFSGKLGFEQVLPAADQKVYPEIFGIQINDDAVDESFTVYDHPHVLVFKKVRSLTTDELRTLFGNSINQPALNIRHLEVHTPADYDKSLMLSTPPDQAIALGDYAWNPIAQNQWIGVLLWVLAVEIIGLLAWPLTAIVCRRLPDRGYPLSKALGLLLVAWLVWMVASLQWIPFTVYTVVGAVLVLAFANALIWRRFAPELREWWAAHRRLILAWEALFLVAFAAFLIIRMLDPDLWQPWNGGEKPMEFGFMNSILRSPWMPPGDPFFAGGYINYYYYGWVILGVLIKLIGIDPAVAFNLSIPLLFALAIIGGGSVVYNAVTVVQRARGWRSPWSVTALGWGVVGAVLLAVIGNLTFLLQFISMKMPALQNAFISFMSNFGPVGDLAHSYAGGFDYWGGATRVIANTINEWPFWTFLFADLHPHLIDIAFSLLAMALIFNLLLGAWRWPLFASLPASITEAPVPPVPAPGVLATPTPWPFWRAAGEATRRLWGSDWLDAAIRFGVTSLALGTLYAVNSWDFPVYLLVGACALLVAVLGAYQAHAARRAAIRWGTAVSAALALGLTAVMGLVLYAPFVATFKPFYNQIKWITPDMQRSGVGEFLAIWGLFVFIGFSYLAVQLWKYPWRATFDGVRAWVLPRGPAEGPAIPSAGSMASTRLRDPLALLRPAGPRLATAAAGAGGFAGRLAVASIGRNGHGTEDPARPSGRSSEEWDDYALGDIGALGLELDDEELAHERHLPAAVTADMAEILAEPGLTGDAVETNGHASAGPEALPNGHDASVDAGVLVLPDDRNGVEAAAPPEAVDGEALAGEGPADLGFEWEPEPAPTAAPARAIRPVASTRLPGLIWPIAGVAILVVTVVLAVGMFFAHQWLSGLLILLIGGLTGTHLGGVRNPGQLFGGLLLAVAFGIALGVEYVYLADHLAGGAAFRMNTVFKFYEQVWILVACGSAIALYAIIGPRGRAGTSGDAALALAGDTVIPVEVAQDVAAPLPVDGASDLDPALDAPVMAAARDPGDSRPPPAPDIEPGGAVPRPPPTPEPDVPPQPPDQEPVVEPMEIPAFPGTGAPPIITVPGRTDDPLTPPEPDPVPPPAGIPGSGESTAMAPDGAVDAPAEPDAESTESADAVAPAEPAAVLAAAEAAPAPGVTLPVHARRVRLAEDGTAATPQPPEAITPVPDGPVRPAGGGPRSWWTVPRIIWLVPFAILVLGSFIFTVAGTQARVADRFPGARPDVGTLNGMDWMNVTILTLGFDNNKVSGPINYKYERDALDWMNTHINGTPVIAAAPREYYRESGMMPSTYTGLPMVVGGLHQDEQRYGWEVGERRDDMNNFYRDADVQQTLLLINKYDIEYIYVGQIETIGYQDAPAGIAKFKDMVGPYLDVAYQNDLVTIYRVRSAEVAANVGSAPGAAPAPKPTPKPAPPAPDLSNDPVLKGLLTTVQNAPSNVDGRRALAEYYRSHNALDKAIEQYQAVVQLAPQDVAAHHILGDLYTQQGEPDKALAIWEAAVQDAGPNDKPAAYNKVGMAYQERQRFDDAINAFKAAVAANPSFVEAWYHMGETYQTMQNVDAARQAFQSTIQNAPADDSGKHWAQQAQQALDALP